MSKIVMGCVGCVGCMGCGLYGVWAVWAVLKIVMGCVGSGWPERFELRRVATAVMVTWGILHGERIGSHT